MRDRGRDRQIRENSVTKAYLLGFQFLHLQNRQCYYLTLSAILRIERGDA